MYVYRCDQVHADLQPLLQSAKRRSRAPGNNIPPKKTHIHLYIHVYIYTHMLYIVSIYDIAELSHTHSCVCM